MDITYRTLDQALGNTAMESPSLKRKWEAMSKKTSSSSSSSDSSYDGPIVKLAKFRASTAPLPQRPTKILPILPGPKLEQWAACRDEISRLLKEEEFDFRSVSILNVKDSSSAVPRATLIIEAESTKEQSRWRELIISACHVLHVKNCLELEVEIHAPNPNSEMRVFAVPAFHPVVAAWPLLRAQIIELLQHYEWETLDMLLYGETIVKAKPTVFITTKDTSHNDWSELLRQVKTLSADVSVEVLEGQIEQVGNSINDETPTSSPCNQTYQQMIDGGWSIGVEKRRSGTLGGYIKLCDPQTGAAKIYGLTNYHVVRPTTRSFDAAFDEGTATPPWPSEYSKAECPSQEDHDQEIDHLQRETQRCDREVGMSQKLKIKVQMEEATPLEKRRWETLTARKGLLDARLEMVLAIDLPDALHFGNVVLGSGYRKAGEFALDWALVEVTTDRVGKNRLPSPDELSRGRGFAIQGTHVSVIDDDFDTQKEGVFFKIGRTTGLTMGRYSHTDTAVSLKLPFNSSHKDGDEAPVRNTHERVIVIEGGRPSQFFSEAGDSGSWVFDNLGSLAGMIWGSSAASATYFTPIGLIIADIEERTGMKRLRIQNRRLHNGCQANLFENMFYLLGLTKEIAGLFQKAEHSMAKFDPPRGSASIAAWRSETLQALAATEECQQSRKGRLQEMNDQLFKELGWIFPKLFARRDSMIRFYQQVLQPAAKVAMTIRTSASTYTYSMAENPFRPQVPLGLGHMTTHRMLDVKNGSYLKPNAAVVADKDRIIGKFIIPLEPGLYRIKEGKDKTTLLPVMYLVELNHPVAKHSQGSA